MRRRSAIAFIVLAMTLLPRDTKSANAAQVQDAETVALLNSCLYESVEALREKGIIAERIRVLSVDVRSRAVDEILCVSERPALGADERPSGGWYRLDRTHPDFSRAFIASGFRGEVRDLRASPDGRFLAIQYSAEGHPFIEVVELPGLLLEGSYKLKAEIASSDISIESWDGPLLRVTSDSLLGHPSHPELYSEETFSLNIDSGRISPQRETLQDPVRYYCDGLHKDMDIGTSGLIGLGSMAGVACLERALSTGDENTRKTIRYALDEMARTKTNLDRCVSETAETLKAESIIAEPVRTLFVERRSRTVDQLLCVVNRTADRTGRWYRIDRAEQNREGATVEAGNGDPVRALRPSPDGKYLAIEYGRIYEESVGYVEIIDLPALIGDRRYKRLRTLHGYPYSVEIRGWAGDALDVMSDAFLTLDPVKVKEYESHTLRLIAPAEFSWDIATGEMRAHSDALRDPVQYFCRAFSAEPIETRRLALQGLTLLNDGSAISCLESALEKETDSGLRSSIREMLPKLKACQVH